MKKKVFDFIKKNIRKKIKTSEFYKSEIPEHFDAFLESSKELVVLTLILHLIFQVNSLNFLIIFYSFSFSFFLWKTSQKSILSWSRLKKLHRIIREEKYSIEHKKSAERKELEMIYRAKGFTGDLLKEVVDVLMADENRLLQVMIEEEMGLFLRKYEHPLKIALFAGLGVICSFIPLMFVVEKKLEFYLMGAFLIILNSIFFAKEEKSNLSFTIVWNLAIVAFICFATFFITKIFI